MDKKDLVIEKLIEFIYQARDMVEKENQRSKVGSPFAIAFQVEAFKAELDRMIQAIELLGLKPTPVRDKEAKEREQ